MEDHEIISTMREIGGSFAKALANAWGLADASTKELIKSAFPELWERYRRIAESRKD